MIIRLMQNGRAVARPYTGERDFVGTPNGASDRVCHIAYKRINPNTDPVAIVPGWWQCMLGYCSDRVHCG
jgi:hypothetical protein